MWNKLDEQKRKLLAIVVAVATLYLAYRFSFKLAFEAYGLNSRLRKEASLQQSDAAYPHLNKKYLFYQKVLAGYQIKPVDIENRLWQELSNMALAQQVKITYQPVQLTTDTSAVGQKVFSQQFGFKGHYFNLVKLLDTLGRTEQLGRVSQLSIFRPKEVESVKTGDQLEMVVSLSAISKAQ